MALRPGRALYGLVVRPKIFAPLALSTAFPTYSTTGATSAPSNQAADSQTLKLPDGRLLGYAEYGQPDGKPLFYFHGYPASRREPASISELAREHGIRLISLDRPGLGASSFQPRRTLRDWPEDVKALADALALKRFSVIGSSGGGPYAIACALKIPSDRLAVAGVFAGAPPWEVGVQHVSSSRRKLGYLAERWPNFLRVMMEAAVSVSRWLLNRQWIHRKIDGWLVAVMKKAKENSGEEFETPKREELDEMREQMVRPFMDHFAQGAAGFVQETQILVRPWGFPFEDVKGRVQIYHGTKDDNAPIEMMRELAKRLPNCDLQEFEEDNHYTSGRHAGHAMAKLVSGDESMRV